MFILFFGPPIYVFPCELEVEPESSLGFLHVVIMRKGKRWRERGRREEGIWKYLEYAERADVSYSKT